MRRFVREDLTQSTEEDLEQGLSSARMQYLLRGFRRFRAFEESGSFEEVYIVFGHFRYPHEVNLRYPGFP